MENTEGQKKLGNSAYYGKSAAILPNCIKAPRFVRQGHGITTKSAIYTRETPITKMARLGSMTPRATRTKRTLTIPSRRSRPGSATGFGLRLCDGRVTSRSKRAVLPPGLILTTLTITWNNWRNSRGQLSSRTLLSINKPRRTHTRLLRRIHSCNRQHVRWRQVLVYNNLRYRLQIPTKHLRRAADHGLCTRGILLIGIIYLFAVFNWLDTNHGTRLRRILGVDWQIKCENNSLRCYNIPYACHV